jgi:hypothetical protein
MGTPGERRREILALVKKAREQGWGIDRKKAGWQFRPVDKAQPPFTVHETCSDHRAYRNIVARLRRAGLRGV